MMFSPEKKIASFIEKRIIYIVLVLGIILSLIARLSSFGFISDDMSGFLIGWFGQIEQLGRIHALNTQVGNYSVTYQTLISLMTYIPIDPVIQYKALSVVFDYSLALAVGLIIYELKGKNRIFAIIAGLIVLFSPLVMINSSVWGQCDSIYTSFAVWSLYFFIKKKYPLTFIMYALAFSFKLQAIFLLPFFLFAYLRKKEFSILNFFIIPLVMEIVCIPAMIMGRGFKAAFSVYYYQTDSCDKMYFNYPSFWTLFSDLRDANLSREYIGGLKIAAIILTFIILLAIMSVSIIKNFNIDKFNTFLISFLLVYSCVLFLPGMHERYGYLYEIIGIIIIFIIPHIAWPLGISMCLSCITYGISLFGNIEVNPYMGIINLLAYAISAVLIYRYLIANKVEKE
ncbi:MAG: hypothetical protein K5654_01610 [Lachnospiraceae bacterium]|nr:hypothetical protein [Lachnospiraceae bacterium]